MDVFGEGGISVSELCLQRKVGIIRRLLSQRPAARGALRNRVERGESVFVRGIEFSTAVLAMALQTHEVAPLRASRSSSSFGELHLVSAKRRRISHDTQRCLDFGSDLIFIVGAGFLLGSHAISIKIDLRGDMSQIYLVLACKFDLRKGCNSTHEEMQTIVSLLMSKVILSFGGRRLDEGVPLREYGLEHGSNVQATSRLLSEQRIHVPVFVHTPYAEASGLLAVHGEHQLDACITPSTFHSIHHEFGCSASLETSTGEKWQLSLRNFSGMARIEKGSSSKEKALYGWDDVWKRLTNASKTMSRIHVNSYFSGHASYPYYGVHKERDRIGNVLTDSQGMKVRDIIAMDGLVFLLLLRGDEQLVYDTTELFRNDGSVSQECCICLETMMHGQVLRRLPCMHILHGECAMRYLTAARKCPMCRCSIAQGQACAGEEAMEEDEDAEAEDSEDSGTVL